MKEYKIGIAIFVIAILFFAFNIAWSTEYHHSRPILPSNTTTNTTNIYSSKGIALGIAAAQHHYKATTALQWSVGGGSYNGNSAISGGLGIQAGKVFVSCNASSDGRTSAIGCGGSGTF